MYTYTCFKIHSHVGIHTMKKKDNNRKNSKKNNKTKPIHTPVRKHKQKHMHTKSANTQKK